MRHRNLFSWDFFSMADAFLSELKSLEWNGRFICCRTTCGWVYPERDRCWASRGANEKDTLAAIRTANTSLLCGGAAIIRVHSRFSTQIYLILLGTHFNFLVILFRYTGYPAEQTIHKKTLLKYLSHYYKWHFHKFKNSYAHKQRSKLMHMFYIAMLNSVQTCWKDSDEWLTF